MKAEHVHNTILSVTPFRLVNKKNTSKALQSAVLTHAQGRDLVTLRDTFVTTPQTTAILPFTFKISEDRL